MVDRSIVRRRAALRRSERPPEMRGQFNAETGAQPFHAFDILFGGHVSMSMAQHLGIGGETADWDVADRSLTAKTRGWINPILTVSHTVHTVASLVERDGMDVNFTTGGIRENEVARRTTRPDDEALTVKNVTELLSVTQSRNDIDVFVWPSLLAEKRINTPTAVEPYLDMGVVQQLKQLHNG